MLSGSHPGNLFFDDAMSNLVEKVGSGLLRINEAMEKYELPTPLIDADKHFFKITFIRPDLQKRTIEERITKGEKTREKTRE